jgi:hypothetical protein
MKINKTNNEDKTVAIFEDKKIRRTWHNEQWYFAIVDIVKVLTDSVQPEGYIKDMRRRDEELSKGWGQIATPLSIETSGGKQNINCADLKGIFRIIQSIPSQKAEPFKNWLAKVGQERIEEIQDPEKAITRAKGIYEQKGYNEDWISKRMRGINVRNTLTDEWKIRGGDKAYGILTNEIYQGTFDMNALGIKNYKELGKTNNPRDHMNELELILTMLGEATTTELTQTRDSKGFSSLQKDAKDGGKIAGDTRKQIEVKSGKKVMTKENFLYQNKKKKLK